MIGNFRWLPRVLEFSNAMLAHAVGSELVKDKIAVLFLPASENDAGGTGVVRPPRYTCSAPIVDQQTCPAHTLAKQVARSEREAGVGVGDDDAWEVPLSPSFGGDIPSKAAVMRGWGELIPREAALSTGQSASQAGAKPFAKRGWFVWLSNISVGVLALPYWWISRSPSLNFRGVVGPRRTYRQS